jgi:FkbM family methyltransferase
LGLSIRQFKQLLADQAWLRRYRARRAATEPFRIRLAYVRDRIRKLTHREWKPSYILRDGDAGYLTYVPAPVDLMAGRSLLKPSAPPLLLKTLLSSGDTFIDVGANIGDWTLPAAKLVGPTGRVLAFEPVPHIAGALRKSAWANRFAQVRVFEAALSDHAGEVDFSVEKENSGGSRLGRMPDDPGRTFSGHRVKVTTLDDVVGAEGLKAVALVKIDVEGFEAEVLQGATRMLAQLRPALYFEIGLAPPGKRRIIGDLLARSGYELVGIDFSNGIVEAAMDDYVQGSGPFEGLTIANLFALPAAPRS